MLVLHDTTGYGQADLAGNVAEWVLDYFGAYSSNCDDCYASAITSARGVRGGSYIDPFAEVSSRSEGPEAEFAPVTGVRCARSCIYDVRLTKN